MQKKKGGLMIHITDGIEAEQDDSELSALALNTRLKLSRIFASNAQKKGMRYYHFWVQNAPVAKHARHHANAAIAGTKIVIEDIKIVCKKTV